MNFPQHDTAVVSLRLLYNVFIRNIRIFETMYFVFNEYLSCTVAVCRYIKFHYLTPLTHCPLGYAAIFMMTAFVGVKRSINSYPYIFRFTATLH